MKKILASCLTCCALIGSMCFSSPMAQVHATESITEQSSGTVPIDLNVDEKFIGFAHLIETNLRIGDKIKVKHDSNNLAFHNYAGAYLNIDKSDIQKGIVNIANTESSVNGFFFILTDMVKMESYQIYGNIVRDNKEKAKELEIDLSKTSAYEAKIGETEGGEDITTPVKVTPVMRLSVNKTTKTLPAGSSFELKLPEKIASTYEEKYNFKNYINTIKELKINGVAIEDDQYSNYIKEVDPQNPWKISLLPTIKAGDKVSFKACSVKNEASTTKADSDEHALATYETEPPQEKEEEYSQIISPDVEEYPFPVELTIVEKEKDENINNKEDEIKDEINSEEEPSSGEDETPVDEEKNSDEEPIGTAYKTGDSNSAVIFAAFAAVISGILLILRAKKTIKK